MKKALDRALVWFRRDLRCSDHAALHHALRAAHQVWCAFVYDRAILDPLPRADRRVEFIHASIARLNDDLGRMAAEHGRGGVHLIARHAFAATEIPRLATALGAQAVYVNHDEDPAAVERDATVRDALREAGIALYDFKDHVVFERSEILSGAGTPYSVFTAYKNAWLKRLQPSHIEPHEIAAYADSLASLPPDMSPELPALDEMGFSGRNLGSLGIEPGSRGARRLLDDFMLRIDAYDTARNFPAVRGSSDLSIHLRFGTVSVREAARAAWQRIQTRTASGAVGARTWLSELIWRDFYQQILHHDPRVVSSCFKRRFDAISWEQGARAEASFRAWYEGRTGYPLVDAAMVHFNRTGTMHNRLRMISASFLVKDLGLDWRWGERYFATHLNDYDLAANNGGWQWAASTGCDAQPWFRIFHPVRQSEKFDPAGEFIRRHLPQLSALPNAAIHAPWTARPVDLAAAGVSIGKNYPAPIVDHEEARVATLARYRAVDRP